MIAFFKVHGRWLEALLVSSLLVAAFSAPASSRSPGVTRAIRNSGTTRLELVEFKFK